MLCLQEPIGLSNVVVQCSSARINVRWARSFFSPIMFTLASAFHILSGLLHHYSFPILCVPFCCCLNSLSPLKAGSMCMDVGLFTGAVIASNSLHPKQTWLSVPQEPSVANSSLVGFGLHAHLCWTYWQFVSFNLVHAVASPVRSDV